MNNYMKVLLLSVLIQGVIVLAGCSTQTVTPSSEMLMADVSFKQSMKSSFAEYVLQPGDILDILYQLRTEKMPSYRLNIHDQIELRFPSLPKHNQQQVIRSDGMITLPWVGDVRVLGLTPGEATKKVRTAYNNILKDPDVYLIVMQAHGSFNDLISAITSSDKGQSKFFTIRPDGFITLPVIGDVRAGGRSMQELSRIVNEKYHSYYSNLVVSVLLDKIADQRIFILGEVNQPGAFEITRPMDVGQVLALAGGPNQEANLNDVIIVRRNGEQTLTRKVDYKSLIEGYQQHQKNQLLLPDDVVYVPRLGLFTAAQISDNIRRIMMFRGWQIGETTGKF